MLSRSLKALAAALLVGSSAMALAANDGQSHANQLLSDPDYREAWQQVVKKEERLPEWVMNLSGAAEQTTPNTPRIGAALSLDQLEKAHIGAVLATSETLDQAAKTLGIDASTLYRKRKQYNL